MTIYFTSDTHFNHINIIRLANRPFGSLEEMNEAIIDKWNKTVSPGDEVYHLGDFCMGHRKLLPSFLERLNGTITLVKGNHDYPKTLVGFHKVIGVMATHASDLGGEGMDLVTLSHEPMTGKTETIKPIINLCGHVHGSWNQLDTEGWRHYNVGVDVRDFKPVTFAEIMAAPSWQLPTYRWHHKQTDLGEWQ